MNFVSGAVSEPITTCACEETPPLTAYLATTEMNLSECQAMLDTIFEQMFGAGQPRVSDEKTESMLDQIIKTRDMSDNLMRGLKELCRRLGI